MYSDDSLDSLTVTFSAVVSNCVSPSSCKGDIRLQTFSQDPVAVAPGVSPVVSYSVRTISDPQVVLTGDCNATLCQYQINFTSDNRPSDDFTVSVTVSNGLGGGQSVNTAFQGEFDIVHPI